MELRSILDRGTRAGVLALSFTTAVALMTACGLGFKQDPLANTPAEIKDHLKPISSKPETPPTPASFEYQIDHKAYFVFEEDVAGEEFIKSRILTKIAGEEPELGKNYHIRIENLRDFKGATFDQMSGRFSWRPEIGAAGGEPFGLLNLVVWLETTKGARLGHPREIPVHVRGHKAEPTIVSVDNLTSTPLQEGEKREFKVVVKDVDSASGEEPKIIVLDNTKSKLNIAPHIMVGAYPLSSVSDPTVWEFKLTLDATRLEATKNTDTHSFLLVAISRYGQRSEPKIVDAKFKTSIERPTTTWGFINDPTFFVGEMNRHDFVVLDPKGEGTLKITFNTCPAEATCSCNQSVRGNPLICTIVWMVDPLTSVGSRRIHFTAENQSPVAGDPSKTDDFFRNIYLRKRPPTPTPAPTATPTP